MEKLSLKDTIYQVTLNHLENNNGLLFGQCVTDAGGIAGTVPLHKNVIDTPMADVSIADFAVGCALVGRRPIFVSRFQNFMLLNGSAFIAFAAVYKSITNIGAPVFIRSLCNDYLYATHSNVVHSTFMHYPGMMVCAPATPGEYREAWDVFMANEMPMYVSEYRDTFQVTEEFESDHNESAALNIFAVSVCRLHAVEAQKILREQGIEVNVIHVFWLKPFHVAQYTDILSKVNLGLVVDPGYEICGTSESLAYQLMANTPNARVLALGLEDAIKTTNPKSYNAVPGAEKIVEKVLEMLKS